MGELRSRGQRRQQGCRTPKSRPYGQFDFAAADLHALEGLRQVGQANLLRHKVVADDIAATNGFESLANESRSVVEGRNERNYGIVDGCGVNDDVGARGQSAEKIDNATAANDGKGLLPSCGIAGRFDDRIGAALVFGERSDGGNDVGRFGNVDGGDGAEPASDIERGGAARQRRGRPVPGGRPARRASGGPCRSALPESASGCS